jgi:hypothetical protein
LLVYGSQQCPLFLLLPSGDYLAPTPWLQMSSHSLLRLSAQSQCQNQSYITTEVQSASLYWCQAAIWGPRSYFTTSDSCGFIDVGCSLWGEDVSIVYNNCWPSPTQSFSGSESRGTHDHILLSQIRDSTDMEGKIPVFISPRVTQLYPQELGSLFVAKLFRNVFPHNLVRSSGPHHSSRLQSLRIASNVVTLPASRKESGDGAVISLSPDLQGLYPAALNLEINRRCSQPSNLAAESALTVTSLSSYQPTSQHGHLERW